MTPRVAIIGAGLAGLTAAHRLLARNVDVVVIDKGRHGGGRMCTRRVDLPDGRTARFDLGPPLLYPRARYARALPTYRVMALASELPGENLFALRAVGRIGAAEETGAPAINGTAAVGGMRELAFRLLAAHRDVLEFHDHTLAEQLERTEDGWRIHTRSLRDGSERILSANGLIVTAPVPQALELLERNRIVLPDQLRYALRDVTYSRCMAVYGVFAGVDPLQPGGVWFGDGPFEWITDNHRKDVSEVPSSITALTTNEWATEQWNTPDERVLELLLPRLVPWVGAPLDPGLVWVQRWRWAQPLTPLRSTGALVRDLALVLAGDGFAGSVPDPADAAVMSGEGAAQRMQALLTELLRRSDRYSVARPRRYLLEIAVCTPEEARLADWNGADRLELSAGLEVGGLTPSIGLVREVVERTECPVYVLLRPRTGGFTYSDYELAVMCADAQAVLEAGAAGIVFGALTRSFGSDPLGAGTVSFGINHTACAQLVALARGKAVFHRAFDFIANQTEALDELIELGFERVLTSGGASTAEAGTTQLAALVQHAGWQIEVLPAGNIRPHNVADLVRETRCDQVHSSAREQLPDPDPSLAGNPRLGAGMGGGTELAAQLVGGLRGQLDRLVDALSAQ
jgi:copper homeostasis protein